MPIVGVVPDAVVGDQPAVVEEIPIVLSCTRLALRIDAGADRQAEVEAVDLVLGHQHVAGEVDVGTSVDADTAAVDRVAADHNPIGQSAVEPRAECRCRCCPRVDCR